MKKSKATVSEQGILPQEFLHKLEKSGKLAVGLVFADWHDYAPATGAAIGLHAEIDAKGIGGSQTLVERFAEMDGKAAGGPVNREPT